MSAYVNGVELARPSDPPLAFREDRRGKAARSDRDFAGLAAAYVAALPERRRKLAGDWAERFGRTPQRWRMDLKRASQYLTGKGDELRLTADGERLAHGSHAEDAAIESAMIAAQSWLRLVLGPGAEDAAERAEQLSAVKHFADRLGRPVSEVLRDLVYKLADEARAETYFYGPEEQPRPRGVDQESRQLRTDVR